VTDALQLDLVVYDAWAELAHAVVKRQHAFHTPTFVSLDLDGAPVARTVVMRAVSTERAEIRCHTDRRSPKIREITRDPRVSWHFYAPELKLQLRLKASATAHFDDQVADDAWAKSSLSSRRCYLAPSSPGAECAQPSPNLPEHLLGRVPTLEESLPGRENFSVISTTVDEMDWLWLAADGHRRARFMRVDTEWRGTWLEA
jgi:pyridoxine/pyridoxamine 5'-phosphate oxidase